MHRSRDSPRGEADAPRERRGGKLGLSRNFETAVQSNADDAKIRGWKSPSRRAAMGTSGVPSLSAPLAEARGATSRVFARVFASASVCP